MTILMIALVVLTLTLWIWALVDIFKSKFENSSLKILWIAAILIFPIIGSIIYFQVGKKVTIKSKKFQPNFTK